MDNSQIRIGIIGMGYVGLPLAVAFGRNRKTLGFDVNKRRINELSQYIDKTLEVDPSELKSAKNLKFTTNSDDLSTCNFFIITVPTPIDSHCQPDLSSLQKASKTVGQALKKGDVVVYESTVYPGCTEEECVPILEKYSKLKLNIDFFCGYSPERINPGDKTHKLENVKKVVSGSTKHAAELINSVYLEIINAGTYMAESIKVAEAAKVIENTQRDLNIALINELSIIFKKIGVDTDDVLRAAATKWNFMPFKPGLVGGHCIGVDPYYLTYKSQLLGYQPEIILAGRRLNDGMSRYVTKQLIRCMLSKSINVAESNILIMGFTFKENCPDYRNTKVADIYDELRDVLCNVDVYDPWIDQSASDDLLRFKFVDAPQKNRYDAILIAVAHSAFKKITISELKSYAKDNHVIYDLKHIYHKDCVDIRL